MLFTTKTEQPHTDHYAYAYSNNDHNVATCVLLTQQLFTVLFFLIKFKALSLKVEWGLATKLCAKAMSSK